MPEKNQMPRAGFEPTTPRSHDRCSNHWATEATTVEWVKYWLQRKHRLPDICSQTSRTGNYFCRSSRHAHRTRCYRPYKCVPRHISNKLFIIREVNSDMPIYILNRTNAGKKIRCPERDLNPRHPDLMTGALTTELPRQPLSNKRSTKFIKIYAN